MLLDARKLEKTYQQGDVKVQALRGVDVSLKRGEFVSIMGPSGSGKSTLLHLIGGLDRPTSGSIVLEGQAIEKYSDKDLSEFRRRKLGFIFQFFNLLPTLTAIENVALPMLLDGQPMSQIHERAKKLLDEMGLGKRLSHRPDQLSGGEMQRVAIARALIGEPSLILADEPTGNLDSKTGKKVLETLRSITQEYDKTVLMVTHDANAASYGTRKITLRDGLIESDELVSSQTVHHSKPEEIESFATSSEFQSQESPTL